MIELYLQPDKEDDFISRLRDNNLPVTRKYDGCEGVDVVRNQDDSSNVSLIEHWVSHAHYEK